MSLVLISFANDILPLSKPLWIIGGDSEALYTSTGSIYKRVAMMWARLAPRCMVSQLRTCSSVGSSWCTGPTLLQPVVVESTLHELEALQKKRAGGAAPLARLDVQGLESQNCQTNLPWSALRSSWFNHSRVPGRYSVSATRLTAPLQWCSERPSR